MRLSWNILPSVTRERYLDRELLAEIIGRTAEDFYAVGVWTPSRVFVLQEWQGR